MSAAVTAQLVTDALVMAIWRRGKPDARLARAARSGVQAIAGLTAECWFSIPDSEETAMRPPGLNSFFSAISDFASGKDTPRAFLDRCLAAVAEFEPEVGAFVHLEIESAKAAADHSTERWRQGRTLSQIDGIPVGIKDIIETSDMPTQMGSPLYAGWRSGRDSASVAALREAGAIVLGKTTTTEFASRHPFHTTRNPWDLRHTPGGSSSGSAAAAACGMVPAALGTQGLSSILRPASYCGCIGFKPSVGAINRGGSLDTVNHSVHGALGASLGDVWIVLREIADRAGGDPGFGGLKGPSKPPPARKPARLAVLETEGWREASPQAKSAFAKAIDRIGDAGVAILRAADSRPIAKVESAIGHAMAMVTAINAWDMRWPMNSYRNRDASKMSEALLATLATAEAMTLEDYRARLSERAHMRAVYAELTDECDAALTLAATGPAPQGLGSTGNGVFGVPSSLLGVPAISLPLLKAGQLPLGLQAMGFLEGDATLFATAGWLMEHLRDN
jgi:Asp-tRNA(Asn)/Glu-tRNA(Gln) amidotransferase A subunit family amidase